MGGGQEAYQIQRRALSCSRYLSLGTRAGSSPVNSLMLEDDLQRFYAALSQSSGGLRRLATCHGRLEWPPRGVYFFFEDGEVRSDGSPRVVRVGTHAVSANSQTTLWKRLSQHRGPESGVGNHRGSIFRLHVGGALLTRDAGSLPNVANWGSDAKPTAAVDLLAEAAIERAVSAYIGRMPFVFVGADDAPSRTSCRAVIERNSIGLLTAARRAGIEGPSEGWLGHSCPHPVVRASGLWNVNHVEARYDPTFLDLLESAVPRG